MAVDCAFYVRIQVTDEPSYRYVRVNHSSRRGDGNLRLDVPPAVGDIVFLYDKNAQVSGCFVVLTRSWQWSSYGSYNWPVDKDGSTVPPLLDLVCEQVEGPFRNDAPEPEE